MDLSLIIVPYGLDRYGRGTGAGPDRILSSGLEERLAEAGHRVKITRVDLPDAGAVPETLSVFRANALLAGRVKEAVDTSALPVVLAGNCSTAAGTLAGLGDGAVGALWFDAHGDFNTPETTTTGYLDGMALAIAAGRCWRGLSGTIPGFRPLPEGHAALLGVRDLDPREAEALSQSPVILLGPDRMPGGLAEGLSALRRRVKDVYLHLDMDVLDPGEGQANAYAAEGGLSARDLSDALDFITASFSVRALAVTAYDPAYDPDGRISARAVDCIAAVASSISGRPRTAP